MCFGMNFVIISNLVIPSTISIIKLYMSWKASQARIAKPWVIISIIMYGVCYIDLLIIGLIFKNPFYEGHVPSVEICANLNKTDKSGIGPLILITNVLFLVVFGVFTDFFLLAFVRNRNKNHSNLNQLIPWNINAVKENVGVPTKTTILTLVSILLIAITLTPSIIYIMIMNEANLWLISTILTTWIGCQLPLLLIFTINHQKKTVVKNQPPKSLHFHNNDDASISDNQPPKSLHFHSNDEAISENELPKSLHFHCNNDAISDGKESFVDHKRDSISIPVDSNRVESINILPGRIINSSGCMENEHVEEMKDITILPGAISLL